MQSALQDLFLYNYEVNKRYISVFEKTDVLEMPEKAVNLFSHVLNAHAIWLARLAEVPVPTGVWDIHPISDFSQINEQVYQDTLPLLEQANLLNEQIHYENSKGLQFHNSRRDVLLHVINHSTYHRAQIAGILKDSDVKVPNSDYIFFRREELI